MVLRSNTMETSSTRPGCQPTWPCRLPGMGPPQLLWVTCFSSFPPSQQIISPNIQSKSTFFLMWTSIEYLHLSINRYFIYDVILLLPMSMNYPLTSANGMIFTLKFLQTNSQVLLLKIIKGKTIPLNLIKCVNLH